LQVDWLSPADARWASVLERARHDFYHLPGYALLSEDTDGGRAGALLIEDGDACLWPLLERPIAGTTETDLTSPYGYPGPITTAASPEQADDLLRRGLPRAFALLRERGNVSFFSRLHPLLEVGTATLASTCTVVEHGNTVSLDLTLGPEEGFAAYRTLARRHVRAATRAGFVARHDAELAELETFIRLYNDTMKRIGATPYYFFDESYYERLRAALGDRLSIWLAERDGRVGAAVLFTEVSGIVQYHLSASDAELADFYPTRLVVDAARQWGHARGDQALHLGGGLGGKEDALFFFKAGFSTRRHVFRTARAVLDRERYVALTRASSSSVDPDVHTGFFPAYRAS